MAISTFSTPIGRVRALVRPIPLPASMTTPPPVLDRAAQDALAEQAMPGILVIAHLVETLLATGRVPTPAFWRMPLARHDAVLVAARRCPGRTPIAADLIAVGWPEAALVICDDAVACLAEALGQVA